MQFFKIIFFTFLITNNSTILPMEWQPTEALDEYNKYNKLRDPLTSITDHIFSHFPVEINQQIEQEIIGKKNSFCLLPQLVKKIDGLNVSGYWSFKFRKATQELLIENAQHLSLVNLLNNSILTISENLSQLFTSFFLSGPQNAPLIAYSKDNQKLTIWDINQQKKIAEVNDPVFSSYVHKASQSGQFIASRASSSTIKIFDLKNGIQNTLQLPGKIIEEFLWATTTEKLILLCTEEILIVDAQTGNILNTLPLSISIDTSVDSIALTKNDRYLAFTQKERRAAAAKLITIDLLTSLIHIKKCQNLAKEFTDQNYLITSSPIPCEGLEVLDVENDFSIITKINYKYDSFDKERYITNYPERFAVLPDTEIIVTSMIDAHDVHLWNYKTGNYLGGFTLQDDTIVNILPTNNTKIIICGRHSVQIWDICAHYSIEQLLLMQGIQGALKHNSLDELTQLMKSNLVQELDAQTIELLENIFFREPVQFKLLTHSLESLAPKDKINKIIESIKTYTHISSADITMSTIVSVTCNVIACAYITYLKNTLLHK